MLGDFNAEMLNPHMSEFCALYNFTNVIKEPTCYKNIDKPMFVDHKSVISESLFKDHKAECSLFENTLC